MVAIIQWGELGRSCHAVCQRDSMSLCFTVTPPRVGLSNAFTVASLFLSSKWLTALS